MTSRARRDLTLLLLAALVLLGTGLGVRWPWPPDEPRFALAARDMLAYGDWLFPRIGGDLYPDKPPLFIWLVALTTAATGSLRLGFLLPALLSGLSVLALVWDLARRLWDRGTALAAGLLLLATVQFTLQFRSGQIDALLCLWTTLALYGLLRHLLLGPAWGWYWCAWAAAGLGVITKGVGFLPLLILAPWALLVRRRRLSVAAGGAVRWLAGPVLLVIVVACWIFPLSIVVANAGDPALVAYRDELLFRQTAIRYVDAWGHRQPPWYYLTSVIPLLWLPAAALLPWLLPRWLAGIRNGEPAVGLLVAWILLVLVFFSLSPGKRGVYLLPAVPALVLAAAPWATEILQRPGPRRLAVVLHLIAVAALLRYALWPPEPWLRSVPESGTGMRIIIGAWAIAGLGFALAGLRRQPVAALGGFIVLSWLVWGLLLVPRLDPVRSGRTIVEAVEAGLSDADRLGMLTIKEQFLLHATRPVTHFGFGRHDARQEIREAATWLAGDARRALLIKDKHLRPCFGLGPARHLGRAHRRDWYLVRAGAVAPECVAPSAPASERLYRPPQR